MDQDRLMEEGRAVRSNLEACTRDVVQLKDKYADPEVTVDTELQSQESDVKNRALLLDQQSMVTLPFQYKAREEGGSRRFRTSQSGYEFMLRVFTTHVYLSVSLTMLRSAFVNLLIFPFPYPIYIVLWDLSARQGHVVCLAMPLFARPTGESTDEHVIEQFYPLADLLSKENSFVQDGVFFIRIFIDFLFTGRCPFPS